MRQEFLSASDSEFNARMRLPIVFEDDEVVAIDKPSGTNIYEILEIIQDNIKQSQFSERKISCPNIVYELPESISGVIIITKNKESSAKWKNAHGSQMMTLKFDIITSFSDAVKTEPICCGLPIAKHFTDDRMLVSNRTGRKSATIFEFVEDVVRGERWTAKCTYLRNDQIRLHAHECGLDIINDTRYACCAPKIDLTKKFRKFDSETPHWTKTYLPIHASSVEADICNKHYTMTAPLPKKFIAFMKLLRGKN